jgi:hypothetical protein
MTKMMADVVVGFATTIRKSGGKTVHAVCTKKTLALFKLKRSELLTQAWFLYRANGTVQTDASVPDFKRQ